MIRSLLGSITLRMNWKSRRTANHSKTVLFAVSFEKIVDMTFVPIKSWEKIVSSSLVYIELEYTIGIHDRRCVSQI